MAKKHIVATIVAKNDDIATHKVVYHFKGALPSV
jgi:hypothetical protein